MAGKPAWPRRNLHILVHYSRLHPDDLRYRTLLELAQEGREDAAADLWSEFQISFRLSAAADEILSDASMTDSKGHLFKAA
ncbi:MAG TPA: hypothetical protein VHE81_17420 [Lacipirellulaceae bacterium]|nr:hypothetical protein [Lacipirellulaceae bacterium]